MCGARPADRLWPLCFDRTTQRLWQGPREIRLRARTRAVLRYLLEHPGRVIGREEFAQHVWGGTHVTRSVLRVCIWEIRQALGIGGRRPTILRPWASKGIAGVPQRGAQEPPRVWRCHSWAVRAELATLQTALEQAQGGRLQLVFVAGDPGIGKTTLIRQFLAQVPATTPLWMGWGQCVEHFGAGEAYLPLLEALGQLGRQPGESTPAPPRCGTQPRCGWSTALLVEPGELEGLQRQVQGMRTERMLRQFVEALTSVTRETAVVLVLEDLQWSDTATVETLDYLARCPSAYGCWCSGPTGPPR